VVGRHVTRVARYYRDHISRLPRDAYIELRYEDLCDDPDRTIARVMAFLHLQPRCNVNARAMVQPRPGRVLPEVLDRYRKIQRSLGDYCASQGYAI
jgi:sulfotransferase family protein